MFEESLQLSETIGLPRGVIINLTELATIRLNESSAFYNPKKAEEYLLRALPLADKMGSKQEMSEIHKALADLYKVQKRWEKAHLHFESFYDNVSAVQTQEIHKQTMLMEQRNRNAEREKEIEIAKAAADAKHQATEYFI